MHEETHTSKTLNSWFNFKFRLLAGGLIVGLLGGGVAVLYRFVLEKLLGRSLAFYSYERHHLWFIPLSLLVLAGAGWVTGMLVKQYPITSGSGIPQVKGIVQSSLAMRSTWRALLAKFAGGSLSIGAGLSLGREGPSIQLGALVGQGISRLLGKLKTEENMLITCGASAGLAAAFNAPIAGAMFALEEIHMNFSPLVLIAALSSSLVADFVSKEFFGQSPVFRFAHIEILPLHQYYHLIILGIIVGIMGMGFNKTLYAFQNMYRKMTWLPAQYKPIFAFLAAGILGLFLPQVLGGGNSLVNNLVQGSFPLLLLLALLAIKFVYTLFCYGSSAPGGIFLPMLVVGGLIGVIYCKVVNGIFGGPELNAGSFLIVAMAGYLTASVKSPITAIILITEMTQSFSNLLPTGVVCLAAYMTTELFRSHPVYEVLLERFLKQGKAAAPEHPGESGIKLILEIPVEQGCMLDGVRIKDFKWPEHCLIVAVKRGALEIIPGGEVQLKAGDCLVILTDDQYVPKVRGALSQACVLVM